MPTNPTSIDSHQLERLVEAFRGARSDFAWVLETVGANSIGEMSSSQAVRAMSLLQRKRGDLGSAANARESGTGNAET
jgi:hypothetical protein